MDKFELALISDHFDKKIHQNELNELSSLSIERDTIDKKKPHESGRRYFNGTHTDDSKYIDHQKRMQ